VALAFAGAGLMALAAQVRIPWQPVPFTLQTLTLMLLGLSLGARVGVVSQLAYLGLGLAGAPVFSNMTSGPEALFGPTAGYLFSFLVVSAWLGFAAEKGWDEKAGSLAAVLLIGIAINLGLGWAVLSGFIGASKAWSTGVSPFLLIEVTKAFVVTLMVPGATRAIRALKSGSCPSGQH
jgi:biotin transport system substrate-specific component